MKPGVFAALVGVVLTACGVAGKSGPPASELDIRDAAAVAAAARGQSVRWWMYGGDDSVNRYVDEHVVPAAAELDVTLERVPVADTADAVQRIIAEVRAGRDHGSVDLVWVNGENFALGKAADVWLHDWVGALPNARLLDPDDGTLVSDFGVDTEGQEAPWSRAAFTFAYDNARTRQPPRDFRELLAYARAHPGRVTYPAPPDFTGSAFVRQAVTALGEDRAFQLLRELRGLQWRGGEAFPGSEAELTRLFGDGQVDLAMSYNPAFVANGVETGVLPSTARPYVFDGGTLHNVSFVAIPANAPHLAGALVVANLLLSPAQQATKARIVGAPTVLDLDRLPAEDRRRFTTSADAYLIAELGTPVPELDVATVDALEERWRREVLR